MTNPRALSRERPTRVVDIGAKSQRDCHPRLSRGNSNVRAPKTVCSARLRVATVSALDARLQMNTLEACNLVVFHLVEQGAMTDLEQVGGARAVALRALECPPNQYLLDDSC